MRFLDIKTIELAVTLCVFIADPSRLFSYGADYEQQERTTVAQEGSTLQQTTEHISVPARSHGARPDASQSNVSVPSYGNDSSLLNKKRARDCPMYSTCEVQCGGTANQYDYVCQCDLQCWIYGDCCFDYYSTCLNTSIEQDDLEITRATVKFLHSYSQVLQFYDHYRWHRLMTCQLVDNSRVQLVTKCSEDEDVRDKFNDLQHTLTQPSENGSVFIGLTQEDIITRCHRHTGQQDNSSSLLDKVPITAHFIFTAIHLYNIFCAVCNGIHPANVDVWNTTFLCDNLTQTPNDSSVKHWQSTINVCGPKVIVSKSSRRCFQNDEEKLSLNATETISNKSNVSFMHSVIISPNKDMSSLYRVDNKTKACTSGSCDNMHTILCRRYQYPTSNSENLYSKNPHCWSNVTENYQVPDAKTECVVEDEQPNAEYSGSGGRKNELPNLRCLFDLNCYTTHDDETLCPENHVFAPFYQRCVQVTCPPGSELQGRACVNDIACDIADATCDANTLSVMKSYNMLLPTIHHELKLYIMLEYMLTDSQNENMTEICDTQNGIQQPLDEDTQFQLLDNDEGTRHNLLILRNLVSLWRDQMVESGSANRHASTLQLLHDLSKAVNQTNVQATTSLVCCTDVHSELSTDIITSNTMNTCILVKLQINGSKTIDDVISDIETTVLSQLKEIVNRNNFLFKFVTLTNHIKDSKTVENITCNSGTTLIFNEMTLSISQNKTYLVNFNSTKLPLSKFIFNIHYNGEYNSYKKRNRTTVGWCNVTKLKCPYTHVNSSDIIIFHDYLLVTTNAERVKSHLQQYKNRNITLAELETILNQQFLGDNISVFKNQNYMITSTGAMVCSDKMDNKIPRRMMPSTETEGLITAIALGVSITCLVIVLVVYGLVPELRNVPGKIVMSMSSALLVAQTMFLCCTYSQGLACEIYAALHHAVWLASFAWLAAMSLHLTCVLHIKSQRWFNPSKPTIFYLFSILCWGLPSLLAGICFLLHKTGTVAIDYGQNGSCWIGNLDAVIPIFIVPIFLFLSASSVCAILVIRAIRQSSDFRQKNSQHKREKTQLILCVNLSLMMGLTWLFYFLAVAVDTTYMWIVFILTNGSQGIYIFMCYVARKLDKLFKLLQRKKASREVNTSMTTFENSTGSTSVAVSEHDRKEKKLNNKV